jgi:hypothetical protein
MAYGSDCQLSTRICLESIGCTRVIEFRLLLVQIPFESVRRLKILRASMDDFDGTSWAGLSQDCLSTKLASDRSLDMLLPVSRSIPSGCNLLIQVCELSALIDSVTYTYLSAALSLEVTVVVNRDRQFCGDDRL